MEMRSDILIVGGGVGGYACAVAACENGFDVILTEESDWIGGQLTSQATPPDEHGWIEEFGCTASYRKFREDVRAFYRENYPLTDAARNDPTLNPGNGWVSPVCAEPLVFLKVLEENLKQFTTRGNLRILTGHFPVEAVSTGDEIISVGLTNLETRGNYLDFRAVFCRCDRTWRAIATDGSRIQHGFRGEEFDAGTERGRSSPAGKLAGVLSLFRHELSRWSGSYDRAAAALCFLAGFYTSAEPSVER